MKALLLFLSNIIAFIAFNANAASLATDSVVSNMQRYTFQIETPKAYLSGILITKAQDDCIIGSLVNEFGVSAIDFSFNIEKDKLKLINVVSFLNKWYIKKTLNSDLKFCIHQIYHIPWKKKHHYIVECVDDSIRIFNSRRKLKYVFTPLIAPANYDTEE